MNLIPMCKSYVIGYCQEIACWDRWTFFGLSQYSFAHTRCVWMDKEVQDFQRLEEGETPRGKSYEECLVGRRRKLLLLASENTQAR